MIDIHNHLQNSLLQPHTAEIVSECSKLGVTLQVVNGTNENDWQLVNLLHQQFPEHIIPSYGLHPCFIDSRTSVWLELLEEYLKNGDAWVGEIGIDFRETQIAPQKQEEIFLQQLEIAYTYRRPVSIHCVQAWGRLLELLQQNKKLLTTFILHSYGASKEMIPQFAQLGAFFSYSASVTNTKRKKQREALLKTPIERLFLETDAPYKSPSEDLMIHLTKCAHNSPCTIAPLYSYVAQTREIPLSQLIQQCRSNLSNCIEGVAP